MKLKDKIVYILAAILFLALVFTSWRLYKKNRQYIGVSGQYAMTDTELKVVRGINGELTYELVTKELTISALRQSKDSLANALKREIKHWKNLYAYIKYNTVTNYDTIEIQGESDTIYIGNTIQAIQTFSYLDEWIKMKAHYNYITNKLVLNELSSYDEYQIISKWKRDGWFKKKYLVASIIPENPHTVVLSGNSIVIKNDTRWYETRLAAYIGGVASGILLTKYVLK